MPDYTALKDFAASEKISYHSMDELVCNARVRDMMATRMEKIQKGLASYEKVKRFVLLPRPFSMENGELTNTLKIKRHAVNRIYAKEIDSMYE